MKTAKLSIGLLLFVLIASTNVRAQKARPGALLDELAGYVRIRLYSISPDGKHVAYLTLRPLPREDLYEVAVNLVPTTGADSPVVLARYKLPAAQAIERDADALVRSVGDFAWAPDGSELVYTRHAGDRMEIQKRTLNSGSEQALLTTIGRIELGKVDQVLEFTMISSQIEQPATTSPDHALRIKDSYQFFGPLGNPKAGGKAVVQDWTYRWGTASAVMVKEDPAAYLNMPREWTESFFKANEADTFRLRGPELVSPDGKTAVMIETAQEPPPLHTRTSQILIKSRTGTDQPIRMLVPPVQPRPDQSLLAWSTDSSRVYYLSRDGAGSSTVNSVTHDGKVTNIVNDRSSLIVYARCIAIDRDVTMAVFVRSTNLMPDELVAVDLKTGKLATLARPNARFEAYAKPTVRFISVEGDADVFGRLYLPSDYRPGRRCPLVITQYNSNAGFDVGAGDEVPVLALVAQGIAVFAMNSRAFNRPSTSGRLEFEVNRVAKPLAAMEWVIKKLTDEGVVDRGRVGLTGLSYGSEVAMYAYWKSRAFRAISSVGSGLSPSYYFTAGPARIVQHKLRGLSPSADPSWKAISAGLNGRPDLPPLLWQTPDQETFLTVETWTRLREAGAQVEWWQYPDEGHTKRGPANKWWVNSRNLDWFRFWLKDEEDPDPAKRDQYARWRQMREKWELAKREQRANVKPN